MIFSLFRIIFATIFIYNIISLVRLEDSIETTEPNYRNILNKSDSVTDPPITKPPVNRTKEVILCEIEKSDETIYSSCDLKSFNFTFYALFRPKREVNFKNLHELRQTLSNYSTCEIRYMKVRRNIQYI